MKLNIFIVYLGKASLLCLQLYALIVFGFTEYTELAVLIGTGELLSSFITLGIHSAILRTKDHETIIKHIRVNLYTLFVGFAIFSYFYLISNQYICTLVALAISSSITKLTRAYVISLALVSKLSISYISQVFAIIVTFILLKVENAYDIAIVIIVSQFLSTFNILYYFRGAFVIDSTRVNQYFVRQNIYTFFIRDIASLSSGHLARSLLYFFGLTEAAGLYSICYQIHAYSLQLLVPFNQLVRPILRNHYLENDIVLLSKLKIRWQKFYSMIGLLVVIFISTFLSISSEYLNHFTGIPTDFTLYMNFVLVGTFVCFAMDLNNIWTMLVFKNSDLLIKYMVVVYAAVVLLSQLVTYMLIGDIGFVVGYSFALILVNISNLIIYRYSLIARDGLL